MPHTYTLALFALALTTSAAPLARQDAEPGRPLVLVVHGRGQLARDTGTVIKALQEDIAARISQPDRESFLRVLAVLR